MKIELNRNEHVSVVCEGRLIGEFCVGDLLGSAYHHEEVVQARVAQTLFSVMRNVTDWDAFRDGVMNIQRRHPTGSEDYVGPPEDEKNVTPDRVKQYQKDWDAGRFVRRFVENDEAGAFTQNAFIFEQENQ